LPALLEKALEPYNELLNISGQGIKMPTSAGDILNSLKVK